MFPNSFCFVSKKELVTKNIIVAVAIESLEHYYLKGLKVMKKSETDLLKMKRVET